MTCSNSKDSEKVVERKLVEGVARLGGMALKLLSDQCSGLPDRMVLMPGGTITFVELKTTGEKPRKIQVIRHNAMRALGFEVLVIDSVAGVKQYLQRYAEQK